MSPSEVSDKQVTIRESMNTSDLNPVLSVFSRKMQDGTELTLTPTEQKKLVRYINSLRQGFVATTPMLCAGELCPYSKKCPLGTNNNYPIGKDCPIEGTLLEMWYADYVKELGVDPNSKVDAALIGDIVFWEMLEKRATEELSQNPKILQTNLAGFQNTPDGLKPVYKDEMNQIINFLEKAQRQKLKIMGALIATREAKAKDSNRVISDPSTYAAKLLEKARELTKKAEDLGLKEAIVVKEPNGSAADEVVEVPGSES